MQDPSTRALVARRALVGAALLGIVADPLLRHGYWGLGLAVWMGAFAALLVVLVRQQGRVLSTESWLWLSAALTFAASMAWRDSELLDAFNLLAMLGGLALLAMSLNAIPVPGISLARVRDLIVSAFGTGLDVVAGAVPLSLRDAQLPAALVPSSAALRVTRALALTAPVVLLFTILLAQADPVFGSLFTVPRLQLDRAISHLVVAGFFAWVVAGWLRRALLARPATDNAPALPLPLSLEATDVKVSLGALNLLFLAFVLVQVGWLFGGEVLVLRTTGLGYAEYARRGFFELTLVAGLLLPLLLGAQALIPSSDARALRLYRRLALPLVVLLGAIMVSAFARMQLYVQYYGISTDRLYATAVMVWLAIVFAWLMLTVLRSRQRAFAAGLVISGFAVLLSLNILNPDGLVARANLARSDAGRTGAAGADPQYLASLGGDAVPMLVGALLDDDGPAGAAEAASRCAAARILLNRWTGDRRAQMAQTWAQWNAARGKALETVRANEAELRRLACPAIPATTAGATPVP
jgi:hypothetical protein